jgi:glycerol-3-phosphate dehydrogenase
VPARTADLSRRHSISSGPTGVITVTGGKLTTYREMAEDTVDIVLERLGRRAKCRTRRLRLIGAGSAPASAGDHLAGRYGTEARTVLELGRDDSDLSRPLVPGLRYLRAEAVFAVRYEMATTLVDVLARRTRAHLQDRAACLRAAPEVAELLARELGWDDRDIDAQVAEYRRLCEDEFAAAERPDLRHAEAS